MTPHKGNTAGTLWTMKVEPTNMSEDSVCFSRAQHATSVLLEQYRICNYRYSVL